jgi:hypothetical protein
VCFAKIEVLVVTLVFRIRKPVESHGQAGSLAIIPFFRVKLARSFARLRTNDKLSRIVAAHLSTNFYVRDTDAIKSFRILDTLDILSILQNARGNKGVDRH